MANLDDAKIDELSKSALQGHGCPLRDEFQKLTLNEQLAAMRSLREQMNKANGSGWDKPDFISKAEHNHVYLKALKNNYSLDTLFTEEVDVRTGAIKYTCSEF